VKKFAPLLGFPSSSSSSSSSSSYPPFLEADLGREGQQENGYDCGVYLLGFAEQVLRRQHSPLKFTPKDATNKRKEIQNLIFELAKQRNNS
jgi:hypothetical protein